ncbi:MAG: DUF222 domain-containing protein, partial [Microbacteriaceae bacterium]|nr:DUF222 domain-containing protein [Microbacteriaceae bacterium]
APTASLHGAMANTLGDLIDGIAALDRMEASLAAYKAELIDQARRWSEVTEQSLGGPDGGWNAEVRARRVIASELACALRIPERTAESLIADSAALVDLPQTFAALSVGAISWRHARAIADHARSLPTESWGAFETTVVPLAQTLTVAKFDRRARTVRERLCPESIEARFADAAAQRSLTLEPARDGMAVLTAYLPAVVAHGIYNRITDLATAQQSPAEARTLTQLRADVFAELLLDGRLNSGGDRGIRPRVLVTVPVLTLLGVSDEPATLEGYGPIDHDTAMRLAATAPSFTRLLTHPETGAVLSVGRDRYTVPADLRTWLRVRDGTCRFPGCSRAARICEIDHTKDWLHNGQTAHDNLAHLCSAHHRLKHQTRWTVIQSAGGVLNWTSPNGRAYATEPETRMQPA